RPSGYEPDELPGCSTPRQFNRGPITRGAGTYSRFEDDVKPLKAAVDRPRRLTPIWAFAGPL
ncbi:MAG: hypothetical protein WED13_04230, partial [Methyloceanibacter sp.]